MEAAFVLPLFLCAVTALICAFSFTSSEAVSYRKLSEKAQLLAVTVGQTAEEDPYIRLWNSEEAELPFDSLFHGKKRVAQRAAARAWVGYTGESFSGEAGGPFVYMTPEGVVFHTSRDCTYLNLTVRSVAAGQLESERNQSGSKYGPCEYCVKRGNPQSVIYITDYGTSYHNNRTCQGLKRTVMAVPLSETAGLSCCSRCGGT